MTDWATILSTVTPAQRKVLDAMCTLEGTNDGWHAPIAAIAKKAGVSVAVAHTHLDRLVAAGAVQKSPWPAGGYRAARNPYGGNAT